MNRKFKGLICVVLSLLMIMQVSPISAVASEIVEEQQNVNYDSTEDIVIDSEIESMRTENSKTYLTEDGGYYQVSATVPIHKEVNGEWGNISSVDDTSVETTEDASNLISTLAATYATSINNNNAGMYESETLTMYSNGSTDPMCIMGRDRTDNGKTSCIYVRPNIITDKSVFIFSANLCLSTGEVDYDYPYDIYAYKLDKQLNPPVRTELSHKKGEAIEYIEAYDNDECDVNITSYCHYSSLGIYDNTGIALVPGDDGTYIEVNSVVLSIYYREIGDVDGSIDSETVDLGRAGTLYINDYTCSPLIVRNDFGLFSELAEVNIQTIINPSAIDDSSDDGINTRTNYYSVLQFGSNEYFWKNCDGDYIYFVKNNTNEYIGIDSKGTKYTLINGRDEYNFENITITNEKTESVYKFVTNGSKGYLSSIVDKYNNTISIRYDGNDIQTIIDGSGREYRYNYDNNMLSSINVFSEGNPVKINDSEISINYSYNDDSRLEKVIYPDDYMVVYEYDDNGRISAITSYEDSNATKELKCLEITYENNTEASNVVDYYSLYKNGELIDEVEISSIYDSIFNRRITNVLDGSSKVVQYDTNANLVYYKDYNDQEYYLNYHSGNLDQLIFEDNSGTEYVTNGNFDLENNGEWKHSYTNVEIVNNAPVEGNTYIGATGNRSALKIGRTHNNTYVTQDIASSDFKAGNSYVLSCDARCDGTLPSDDRKTVSASIYYTEDKEKIVLGKIEFDYTQVATWQNRKIVITLPKDVSTLTISLNDCFMTNVCYFDNVSLYPATSENTADVSSYSFETNDKIIYNNNGTVSDIIRLASNDKTLGKHFEYNDAWYVSSINDEGKTTYYNYDSSNGLLMSKGKNSDSEDNTQYVYSGIGALTAVKQAITTATEPINQDTYYTYEDDLVSSISHNGCTYEYSYNGKNQITKITVKDAVDETANTDFSIAYEYENNNVGKVCFGNGSSITYTYDGNNITSTIYDNGKIDDENETFVYSYEYNTDGTIAKMIDEVSNTVTIYSDNGCTVTKNGETLYSNDGKKINLFGKSFSYSLSTSDKNDLKTIKESYSGSVLSKKVDTETTIDCLNRIKNSQITNIGNLDLDTHYRMTDNTEYIVGPNNKETSLVEHYTVSVDKRINLILETYNNTRLSAEWYYNYDDTGRITEIFKKSYSDIDYSSNNKNSYASEKGDLYRYYEYDDAGQVVLEIDADTNTAIAYSYDAGGNLSSKETYDKGYFSYDYNYSTGELTFNPKLWPNIVNLTYKKSGMTDYLYSYNNEYISYDTSGNPIYYSGSGINNEKVRGTMTWNGNLLTSFLDYYDDEYYVYTYDGDGRRTSKTYYEDKSYTNPKSIIEYIWEGDTLVGYHTRYYGRAEGAEKDDYVLNWDKVIKLIYTDGKLVGASVIANKNNADNSEISKYFDWEQSGNYTFVRDGQGNITNIYDPSEKVIVSISYDAYGNMTQTYSGSYVKEVMQKYGSGTTVLEKRILDAIKQAIINVYLMGTFLSIEQGFDGYIFDSETGLYYGQQRYYSPSWGRFLNASDPMTLSEDIGNTYGANLFNYCGNDPINNISKTGFNAPYTVISDDLIPQITNNTSKIISESRATAKSVGEISRKLDILSLQLYTTTDSNVLTYWDRTFGKTSDIVDNSYGLNYIRSAVSKNTSSVTKYSVEHNNSPYKICKSVE